MTFAQETHATTDTPSQKLHAMQKGPPWDGANWNCKSGVNAARRRQSFPRCLQAASCIIQPSGAYLGETSRRDIKGEAPTAQTIGIFSANDIWPNGKSCVTLRVANRINM